MKTLTWTWTLTFFSAAAAAFGQAPAREGLGDAKKLKILYAGYPGGSREASYTKFLRSWFDKVEAIDLQKLDTSTAAPFDVVIADWGSQYGNDGYPKELADANVKLGAGFSKPLVVIGAVGGQFSSRSLFDWL
jgi:hypothetical protein